jgi:hypothetical protein
VYTPKLIINQNGTPHGERIWSLQIHRRCLCGNI